MVSPARARRRRECRDGRRDALPRQIGWRGLGQRERRQQGEQQGEDELAHGWESGRTTRTSNAPSGIWDLRRALRPRGIRLAGNVVKLLLKPLLDELWLGNLHGGGRLLAHGRNCRPHSLSAVRQWDISAANRDG